MSADLIVYALVAAGLVFWLRSILGTRSDDDPAPVARAHLEPNPDNMNPYADDVREITGEERIKQLAEQKDGKVSIEPGGEAKAGLIAIARSDREFDVNFFMDGAQEAFAMVVESFAQGDRETLRDLLGTAVYGAFESAIQEREKRGEKQETQIRAIRKAEAIEARMSGRNAYITVRFTADEVSVTKDSGGNIIEGHPERLTSMRDIWTFSRDIKSRDPRWIVIETRGDFEDDNKIIPNTTF